MQINRLFEITYLLLTRSGATAKELAERFEVSTRTIYRDIDTLSSAGIPVYASKGKGGGIHLLPDFVLNKSLLSEQEQNEILFALQSLKATNSGQGEAVLAHLSALFQRQSTDWIDVDFSTWGGGDTERLKFSALKTGILEHRMVTFNYYAANGGKSSRKVEPVKLRFKGAGWYLQCFCLEKEAYRTFKVIRMQEVFLTEEHFHRRAEPLPELEAQMTTPGRQVTLELLFSPKMAFRVYDDFDYRLVQKNEDGSFSVTADYIEDSWVYGYLLSFGEDVRVVSPSHVQKILEKKAENIRSLYQNN
nr:YafY family protein [uncultured Caproiciproducens sp.]